MAASSASCFGDSMASAASAPVDSAAGAGVGTEYETGGAPIVDMDEAELIALLQEGASGLRRLTPRTIEACAEEGIEPEELLPKKLADFAPRDLKAELLPKHQQARHERFEQRRLAKLTDVVHARRRLLNLPDEFSSIEEAASASAVVEERRRRAEASVAAAARQALIQEEQKASAAATLADSAKRAEEADKRLVEYERQRALAREAKNAEAAERRELKEEHAKIKQMEIEAAIAVRAAKAAAHEVRRSEMLEAKRAAEEAVRHEQSLAKLAKAEAARQSQTEALAQRKKEIGKLIASRQARGEKHAEKQESKRIEAIRDGIERHRKADRAMGEVDRRQEAFAAKTLEHALKKGSSSTVREELIAQRQKAQAEHAKLVLEKRVEADKKNEREARKLLQDGERKEQQRQATLAGRAGAKVDEAEAKKLRYEELLERVERQAKKREFQREKMRAELKAKDKKYFAQRAALDQLHQDKMAVRHKMEAEALKNGEVSMRDIERTSEPGPTSYDNRFLAIGELGPGGKYARVGSKKAPPMYSFGNLSETKLPRVPADEAGKPMTVELIGKISPGPNTASPALGSREVLDKTGKFPRAPSYSIGHLVNDVLNKDVLHRPGPGETHASDNQLSLTRYKSAPQFSFASSNYKEIHAQEKAAALQRKSGKPGTADATVGRDRYSLTHSARGPGPTSYNHSNVQTSLARHRNLSDGVGVSQRFNRADRFIPLDTKPKDDMGPTTYVKSQTVPGPQKYRPSRSYLSTPLSF